KRSRGSYVFVGIDHARERLLDSLRNHGKLRPALLLFQHENRLAECGIPRQYLLAQKVGLGVLAPKTKDRCAGNVGIVNVSCQQSDQPAGILASAATAAFVRKKLDPIHVVKNSA